MGRVAWIMAVAGLLASPLYSQGIQDSVYAIEEVAITVERIFVKEQAGMKRTDVDSMVLQNKASLSLSDLLSENTTVFIKNHGRGALATASFRGSSASHTQVSWNGININSPMAGMVDFSLIPVYIIDELNLKHGSASLADRSGGIGGSINISNRAEWNQKSKIGYLQGIGSYSTFDEFLQVGVGEKKIRSKTRLYHNYSKNDYTFINRGIGTIDPVSGDITNPLDTNNHAAYMRYGMLQEIYCRPRTNHIFSLKYWGQFADRTIPRPTSYEGPDNSNLNSQQDRDHRLVADWKYYGDFGKVMVRSGYAGKKLDYSQMNRVPGLGLIPAIWSESRQQSLFNTLSYSGGTERDLSWEGNIDMNYHQVGSADSVSGAGYEGRRNELSTMFAVRKSFNERVNLNLMLRQEWVDGKRVPFIPYFGMDVKLIQGVDLVLKGNVARNYHQPTLNDLYWQPGGNPNLLPEEGFTVEGGVAHQQELSGQLLKTELSLYRSDIDNWIIWIPSYRGFWEPRNIRRVLSKGVECNIELKGYISEFRYKLSATYGYTSAVNEGDPLVWSDESYGKQLVYIPLHSGNMMVHLEWGNLFFTYQYNAFSERYTTSSNDVTRRDRLYPYYMNDISAGSSFRLKRLDLSLEVKVKNLFNEPYHSVLYRPMPGRNWQLVFKIQI
ncbi:MAG: TonB-dependent receptor plug domain-containing protein [Bacteroidales bacterium]|nr:TonB-dependent receptor plug domain-containing protein [Bacteroidales bacterium]